MNSTTFFRCCSFHRPKYATAAGSNGSITPPESPSEGAVLNVGDEHELNLVETITRDKKKSGKTMNGKFGGNFSPNV